MWRRFVNTALDVVGSVWSFVVAIAFLVLWTIDGAIFGYSDTWQLVLNTVASVVAFLLVFLIQYSQNRDTRAIHLKLDELLEGLSGPRSELARLERFSDEKLEQVERESERRTAEG